MTPTTNTIAELGALVGDPGRASMLLAVLDGRALTARELADRAGVTPQTASRHLSKLLEAGLLRVEPQGRHRYHRLASAEVARMLEAMHVAGAHANPGAAGRRTGPADPQLRELRTCYDHLAGRFAVSLAEVLAAPDVEGRLQLTATGEHRLTRWGLDLSALRNSRRVFCRSCLDWSERRPHLAGLLGAAILDRSLDLHWLRRRPGARSMDVTPAGRLGFNHAFFCE